MAEHVFESPLVEEFYNSCHLKSNGKFCGTGTKGKVAKRVLMSDAARASNAAIRGKSAKMRKKIAAKQAQSKGALDKMAKSSGKIKVKTKYKNYGSGKTDPSALKLTEKYGSRQITPARPGGIGGGGAGRRGIVAKGKDTSNDRGIVAKGKDTSNDRGIVARRSASAQSGGTSGSRYKPNSGKASSDTAMRLTEKYGTRSVKKRRSASEQSGGTSGSKYKNVPDTQPGTGMKPVSALTLKYGTRSR